MSFTRLPRCKVSDLGVGTGLFFKGEIGFMGLAKQSLL